MYANGRYVAIDEAKAVTLDLNGHTLAIGTLAAENDLTIINGNYKGKIENTGTSLTKVLTFQNVKARLGNLQWMTNSGVVLEESEVTVAGNNSSEQCWLEKLTMDKTSKLVLNNVGMESKIMVRIHWKRVWVPFRNFCQTVIHLYGEKISDRYSRQKYNQ